MTHSEIIDKWPSISAFALDLDVPYGTAKAMRRRQSIPPCHWLTLVAKARGRRLKGVTLEALTQARAAA